MENMEFLKAMLAEMDTTKDKMQDMMERQRCSVVFLMEATRKTSRDELKQ
jgi:hypothetical protein